MTRLIGFFVLVLAAAQLLRFLPGIGGLFHGLLGFWLTALLVGAAVAWASARMTSRRRLAVRLRELGNVESAHNQGKLGSLLLANGAAKRAIGPLENAVRGEPAAPEWHYRLGQARLERGDAAGAAESLERVLAIDAEYAYGEAKLTLVRALCERGEHARALDLLDSFDRDHGPSPQSEYLRGVVLRKLGRRDDAREAFRRVAVLAERAVQFQRGRNRGYVWRARVMRLVP